MNRQKKFIVDGKEFIFDGTSVSLLANNKIPTNNELFYKKPNSQRTSYLKTLCLVINNRCNLCCEYCFANKGQYDKPNELMTFETAKKAIDFLINSTRENGNNKITISFFGGEPLLNFTLMKSCVNYIETFSDIDCDYMITTNGTLLTPEIVKFLQKYNFDTMISIDGNKALHDYYRKFNSGKGSYDYVEKGIKLFDKKELLNARITINNHNPEIHQYIDDILQLGVKRITFAVDYNMCYHNAVVAGKNQFENVPRECYQRRIMFESIIRLICKLPTEKRRELLLFYTNLWKTMKGGTTS